MGQPEWGKLLPYPDMLDTYDQNILYHLIYESIMRVIYTIEFTQRLETFANVVTTMSRTSQAIYRILYHINVFGITSKLND